MRQSGVTDEKVVNDKSDEVRRRARADLLQRLRAAPRSKLADIVRTWWMSSLLDIMAKPALEQTVEKAVDLARQIIRALPR